MVVRDTSQCIPLYDELPVIHVYNSVCDCPEISRGNLGKRPFESSQDVESDAKGLMQNPRSLSGVNGLSNN